MSYIDRLKDTLDSIDMEVLRKIAKELRQADLVYLLGNGGSQATVQHALIHLREKRIRAFDLLADNAWVSAMSNDHSYDEGPHLEPPVSDANVLVVFSGSGDSPNVLRALREPTHVTIGFLGFGGGQAKDLCDIALVLPQTEYGPVEDAHLACVHMLKELI